MEILTIVLMVVAVLIVVFYKWLEKKAKATDTVLDDKILTLAKGWADKFLKTKF